MHYGLLLFKYCILKEPLTWAVSGRSESKLEKVLLEASKATGISGLAEKIPRIICDVKDEGSINDMAKKAKCVLNCVGPYRCSFNNSLPNK